ncbi:MAG: FxsA family protein, partial [Parvibaculales bacterium]
LGLSIMRRQGVAVVASAQRAQAEGRAPVAEVGNGIAILLAGLLLLIPGFLTDALGLVLLLQPIRSLIFETVLVLLLPALFAGFGMTANTSPTAREQDDGIIEGDFTINDDD